MEESPLPKYHHYPWQHTYMYAHFVYTFMYPTPQINPFSQERASKVRSWEPGRSEVTISEHSKLVTNMGALASYP